MRAPIYTPPGSTARIRRGTARHEATDAAKLGACGARACPGTSGRSAALERTCW